MRERNSPSVASPAPYFQFPAAAGISYLTNDNLENIGHVIWMFLTGTTANWSSPVWISFSCHLLLLLDDTGPLLVPLFPLQCLPGLSVFPVFLQLLSLLFCLASLLLATFLLFFLQAKQISKGSTGLVILQIKVSEKLDVTTENCKAMSTERHFLGVYVTEKVSIRDAPGVGDQ